MFQNPEFPFAEDFPELDSINDLTDSLTNRNFIAIKVGDVNGGLRLMHKSCG